MRGHLRGAVAAAALLIVMSGATVAAASNPHGTPPGQTRNDESSSATAGAAASTPTPAGFAGCTASASQGAGVKPDNSTEHFTCATAGSNQTKLYGNGETAGQIALSRGAPASTVLYGPGNSQPHKVAVCRNGKTHLVDVHAVKSYANVGACTTTHVSVQSSQATHTTTTTTTSPSAQATAEQPAPSLALVKLERDQTSGGTWSGGPITVKVGDRVDYELHVMNNGNIDLTVHLVDAGCRIRGGQTLDFSGIALAVGHTNVYHCSHVITAADAPVYTNTATANGVAASASVNASSSVSAQPRTASVVANVSPSSVLAARKTIVRHVRRVHHKRQVHLKHVTKTAKAAPTVVKAATFTG
jgi:hypothetical protein